MQDILMKKKGYKIMNSVHSITINLKNTDGMKRFFPLVTNMESDIDLCIDRYTVDAKSIMGVMSLSINKNLKLVVYEKVDGEFVKIKELMRENGFLVEEV